MIKSIEVFGGDYSRRFEVGKMFNGKYVISRIEEVFGSHGEQSWQLYSRRAVVDDLGNDDEEFIIGEVYNVDIIEYTND